MWIALAGCIPQVTSEEGQVVAYTPDLNRVAADDGSPAPMVAGTETCPTFGCAEPCPEVDEDLIACFTWTADGPGTVDGRCATFDAPGTVVWNLVPRVCDRTQQGYDPVDDRFTFEVLDPADLTSAPFDFEAYAAESLSPGPSASFPADWSQPAGEPWQLAADTPFGFAPTLRDADDREVGWTLSQLGGTSDAPGVRATASTDGWVDVTPQLGAGAAVGFSLDGAEWPLVDVVGVDVATVATLEVVAAYDEDGRPVGARAIARDRAGKLVWGAPVQWTLEADLEMALEEPGYRLPGPDYTLVRDACVPPSEVVGPQQAWLTATLGDLRASVKLAWTRPAATSADDAAFTPSPGCPSGVLPPLVVGCNQEDQSGCSGGGCGCGLPLPAGIGALLLAGVVSRRRARPRTA